MCTDHTHCLFACLCAMCICTVPETVEVQRQLSGIDSLLLPMSTGDSTHIFRLGDRCLFSLSYPCWLIYCCFHKKQLFLHFLGECPYFEVNMGLVCRNPTSCCDSFRNLDLAYFFEYIWASAFGFLWDWRVVLICVACSWLPVIVI